MSFCSTLGTRVLLFWFASLLPPPKSDDVDYYEVLEVEKSASKEEIRKAYKKKSLFLHPDKILQRGGNPDDYREEYQNIQEAHTVLSDDNKRQKYNLVNCSVTRYRFLSDDGALAGAYENLVKSSCEKKSRLVLLLAIIFGFILLQPILICVKLNQTFGVRGPLENTDWVVIFIPWWIMHGFYVIFLFLAVILTCCDPVVTCKLLENLGWLVGLLMLSLRWDRVIDFDYVVVFIPIYIAMGLSWIRQAIVMIQLRNHIQRMISIGKLEEQMGKQYEDFTEEEHDQIAREYVIVHIPPGVEVVDDDDDDIIQASPEYGLAVDAYYHAFLKMVTGIIFGIPLVTLIVLKVDEHFSASWWVIFIPVWISIGFQFLKGCYTCCCISTSEEAIEMELDNADDEETGAEVEQNNHTRNNESSFVGADSSMNNFNNSTQKGSDDLDSKSEDQPENIANNKSSAAVKPSSSSPTVDDVVVLEATIVDDHNEDREKDTGTANWNEENFQDFQERYQQAEKVAMEEQQKGCSSVCNAVFQLTIMCLIAGKLEQEYPANGDWGFSAIWIIFPFLLIAGCLLCCWACLIYGAGQQGLDNIVDRMAGKEKDEDDEGERNQGGDEEEGRGHSGSVEPPFIVTPPPPHGMSKSPATETNPTVSVTGNNSKPQQERSDSAGYDDDID